MIPNLSNNIIKEDIKQTFNSSFDNIKSSFGCALHMHQPLIPRDGYLIGNLQQMMDNQHIGDNHNAPTFAWCYERMANFIRELVNNGKNPRIMLDYSGNLFYGLDQMGRRDILENLKEVTLNGRYNQCIEWLGTTWSHAVAPSTPPADMKLHIKAWQNYFASIFGQDALNRVKGFSPPEMHLPIHPDVCYEYIKALKECGYEWMMVQEHTIETISGSHVNDPFVPHKLQAMNSCGEIEEITVLIKTKGSDTKLVAQMEPYYTAKSMNRVMLDGKEVPPYVLQIADGENGGVMMNEFPPKYKDVFYNLGGDTISYNGTEYLYLLKQNGISNEFEVVRPKGHSRIWNKVGSNINPENVDKFIKEIQREDPNFNLETASWTSDHNWVNGYDNVLGPMEKLSILFHQKTKNMDKSDHRYNEALFYLLVSQTSCYRYWGQGIWTDHAKEICQKGIDVLNQI